MDGTVREVNENFARVMGYSRAEVVGKHHSMFLDPASAASADYRGFWDKLNRGESDVGTLQACRQGRARSVAAGFVQPDSRRQRQAVQGGQVRQRRHRADGAQRRFRRASSRPSAASRPSSSSTWTARCARSTTTSRASWATRSAKWPASITACSRSAACAGERRVPRVLGQAQPRRAEHRHLQAHRQGRPRGVDPGVLQPDPRCQRQAVQGGGVRHRRDRARCRRSVSCRAPSSRPRRR